MMATPRAMRSDESGVVLVWAAMLSFALFGLVAVNVDLGLLRLTRQQMENGAEVAALEGLRWREAGDLARREQARLALAQVFDDDLDMTNGDVVGYGAGPVTNLSGGLGSTNASALLTVSEVAAERVWKPASGMELNLANEAHGDLVAGTAVLGNGPSQETTTFLRNDFASAPAGSGPDTLAGQDAFLARVRRASGANPLDRQAGVSSAGPVLPFLFGLGGAMRPGAPGGYNPRTDGLTVRATAIAATERALHVSTQPGGGLTVAAFALLADGAKWDTVLPGTAPVVLELDPATGILSSSSVDLEWGVVSGTPVRSVGAVVVPSAVALVAPPGPNVILPVYADPSLTGGERRVVGFTLASVSITGNAVELTRLRGGVLATGASVLSAPALSGRVFLSADPALAAVRNSFVEPVLAPRLVR